MPERQYVPALRFPWLTGLYDPLVERWTALGAIRRSVIDALDLRPGLRLLELGCGPGRLAIEIKQRHPTVAIDALDVDPAILGVARRNAEAAGVQIRFIQADITRLPVAGPYDRAYSTLVFHHLPPSGKSAALTRTRELVPLGGRIVIADFGRPRGTLQRLQFSAVAWLDGIENTAPHRDGRFEQALRITFRRVEVRAAWRTIFGTIELFVCEP